jgi:hypothetical protein
MGVGYKSVNKPSKTPNDTMIMNAKTCEEAAVAYFNLVSSFCYPIQQQQTDNFI